MSTNLPQMPISTVENSTGSIEKVLKSIVSAEKVLLRFLDFFEEDICISAENSIVTAEKIRREHITVTSR
jgi:hypothetical protein